MNKKFKVIRLNGPFGLLMALVIVGTIIGSITIMPIYGVKFLWNTYISSSFNVPDIRLSQASLLWFAVISVFIGYLRNKVCFKFVSTDSFQDHVMSRTDYEKFIEKIKEEQEENEEIHH